MSDHNETKELMKRLEKEGEAKSQSILAAGPKSNEALLKSVTDMLDAGAKEFEQKTGRSMTYAEMRSMYG